MDDYSVLASIRTLAPDDWSIESIDIENKNGRSIDIDFLPNSLQERIMKEIEDYASEGAHDAYYERLRDEREYYDD
jgi:hypothetical protein